MSVDFRQTWRHVDYLRLEIGLPHPTEPNIVRQDHELGAFGWVTPVPNTAIEAYASGSTPPGWTGGAWTGGYRFTTLSIPSTDVVEYYTESYPVTASAWVGSRMAFNIIGGSTATGVQVKVEFLNSVRAVIGGSAYTAPFGGPSGSQFPAVTQAPAGTAWARLVVKVLRSTTGTRNLFFSQASMVTAASSAAATTAIATYRSYVDSWVNVIAPTHSIEIKRSEIDPGVLSARVLDATIDPAVSTLIRPGRVVRLTVANGIVWEPLFTGTLTHATVQYDLVRAARGDNRHAQITLSAVDNVATLASRAMPYGVAEISHLRSVLEESGVPWNVNGSRNQLSDVIPAVSVHDNATMLDQVVTTRDSKAGFAWVDRRGVLNVFDQATLDSVTLFGKQNLVANPSFESNMFGWNVQNGTFTAVGSTGVGVYGSLVGNFVSTAAASQFINSALVANGATAGRAYTGSIGIKMQGASSAYQLQMLFYNGTTFLSAQSATYSAASLSGTEFRRMKITATSPASTTAVKIQVAPVSFLPIGTGFQVDGALLTESDEELAYFEGTVQQSFSERQYATIDLDYSTTRLINEVKVKSIEWDPANPTQSIEVPYGPYRSEASVREWGPVRREFTVNGLSAAAIGNLALTILIRNDKPAVCANSITVPILTPSHINQRAFLDLYNRIAVGYEPKQFNAVLRIVGMSHTITERGWIMGLDLAPTASVALPQVTPALK